MFEDASKTKATSYKLAKLFRENGEYYYEQSKSRGSVGCSVDGGKAVCFAVVEGHGHFLAGVIRYRDVVRVCSVPVGVR